MWANDGTWNDFSCSGRKRFVCQGAAPPSVPPSPSLPPPPPQPPPSPPLSPLPPFAPFWGYIVVTTGTRNWLDALDECKAAGGTLAEVHSEDQAAELEAVLNAAVAWWPSAWLGLSDNATEGAPQRCSRNTRPFVPC
jgi:hypothetical protein